MQQELFRFSPGELRRDEYDVLAGLLMRLLDPARRTTVVLAMGESPSPQLLTALHCREYDAMRAQWVLGYDVHGERHALLDDLWGLLLGAEPELLFQFDGDFATLLHALDERWFEPLATLREEWAKASLATRLWHPEALLRLSLSGSALLQTFTPLVHHDGMGVFTLFGKV